MFYDKRADWPDTISSVGDVSVIVYTYLSHGMTMRDTSCRTDQLQLRGVGARQPLRALYCGSADPRTSGRSTPA